MGGGGGIVMKGRGEREGHRYGRGWSEGIMSCLGMSCYVKGCG